MILQAAKIHQIELEPLGKRSLATPNPGAVPADHVFGSGAEGDAAAGEIPAAGAGDQSEIVTADDGESVELGVAVGGANDIGGGRVFQHDGAGFVIASAGHDAGDAHLVVGDVEDLDVSDEGPGWAEGVGAVEFEEFAVAAAGAHAKGVWDGEVAAFGRAAGFGDGGGF